MDVSRREVISGICAGVGVGVLGGQSTASSGAAGAPSSGQSAADASDPDLDGLVSHWRTDVPDVDSINSLRRLDDGYALAGTTTVGSGDDSSDVGIVARLAADGTVEWTAEHQGAVTAGSEDRLVLLDAVPTADGLVAVGRYQNGYGSDPSYEPVYVGYDDEGRRSWSRHVTRGTYGYSMMAAPRSDDGFVVFTERLQGRGIPEPELRAFSSDGALAYSTPVDRQPERGYDSSSVTPKDVVATEAGPVVLCSTRSGRPEQSSLPDRTPLRGLVVAYDREGSERWRTEVGTYEDSDVWNTFQRIQPTEDGFVLAGVYRNADTSGALPTGDYLAANLDEAGEQRWLVRGESDDRVSVRDVVPFGEDYLLLGLGLDDFERPYAVHLDGEDGTERRTRTFTYLGTSRYYGVTPAHDGTFVLTDTSGDWDLAGVAPNRPPTAVLDAETTAFDVGDEATFSAANSTDDLGIDRYQWDLYDNVSVDAEGETVDATYDEAGEYEVSVAVVDEFGQRTRESANVTVDEAPDESDGALPGFGVGTALVGLGGAAALRRLAGARSVDGLVEALESDDGST